MQIAAYPAFEPLSLILQYGTTLQLGVVRCSAGWRSTDLANIAKITVYSRQIALGKRLENQMFFFII